MKKRAFLIIFLIALLPFPGVWQGNPLCSATIRQQPNKETVVWICDSPKAVAYHSKRDCSGLNNCKHEIKEVTKSDAVNKYGRRACKICS